MDGARVVIAGGGMVAGYAAKQMVELGLKPGDLAILSADDSVPYERPPLSKGFLAGKDTEEGIRINAAEFYSEHGIEVRLNCKIAGIDPENKRLSLASGGVFGFEKLIVASGARVRKLNVPGADVLDNVHYLRSVGDSKAIRETAAKVKTAVVIGSGFIGMEVTAVLAQLGVEATMIMREDRIWRQFFTKQMSRFFEDYYVAHGVRFVRMAEVKQLTGSGAVSSVALADGQNIPCEMVVAGIGVLPVTEFLKGSGVKVDDGVVVNEFLETSRADVFAAGDVANYPDLLFGKRRRVEHWDNAVSQGQHCARAAMGEREAFRHVPYFFSDVFDLSYEFWGDPSVADETIHRGDLSTSNFSVWWLKEKSVVAAFAMNRPDEERTAAPEWIERKQWVNSTKLEDVSSPVAAAEAAG